MRILHVAESVMGGCGTYLNQIVQAQIADPAISDIRVILPDAHAAQVPDVPGSLLRLFYYPARSARSMVTLARTIRTEVRSFRPDCVHLHSTFAGLLGRLLLGFSPRRPRIIYCAHGWAFDMDRAAWKNRLIGLLERALAPRCDGIVAISEYERQRGIAVGIAPRRITTVHNGLADSAPVPAARNSRGRKRLLFIGRLDRQKGIDILLDAVAGTEELVELRVIGTAVIGDQTIGDALPHVTMLGWCDQARIRAELAAADLVVLPSRWEGFGLVAIEAMRAGRAVVASDVGGLPEVVMDGVTGVLFPPEDSESLREAILRLDHEQLVVMGRAGRERFLGEFTIDHTAAGLKKLYRAVTGHPALAALELAPNPAL